MGDETKEHQAQYVLVAVQYRNKEVGAEVGKDAVKHHLAGFERQVAEEQPCETHEMEGDKDGQRTANATADIAARML
jgi:hypothetical protein